MIDAHTLEAFLAREVPCIRIYGNSRGWRWGGRLQLWCARSQLADDPQTMRNLFILRLMDELLSKSPCFEYPASFASRGSWRCWWGGGKKIPKVMQVRLQAPTPGGAVPRNDTQNEGQTWYSLASNCRGFEPCGEQAVGNWTRDGKRLTLRRTPTLH